VLGEMQKAEQLFATIGLATAAAIFCSGCPALMIPSLAYQGYKYEHNKNQPTAASTSSAQSRKSTSTSQQKIPDSEIE
jgi:hypothetical protein